jgi:bifunctional DNA-binding transcriptional regulator/antitoxin component of YhaV-PrlF toxin-antitoxin module
METYVRKVTRVGKRSLSIVIPAELVKEFKIREKQKLTIYKSGDKIVVKDWDERDGVGR